MFHFVFVYHKYMTLEQNIVETLEKSEAQRVGVRKKKKLLRARGAERNVLNERWLSHWSQNRQITSVFLVLVSLKPCLFFLRWKRKRSDKYHPLRQEQSTAEICFRMFLQLAWCQHKHIIVSNHSLNDGTIWGLSRCMYTDWGAGSKKPSAALMLGQIFQT